MCTTFCGGSLSRDPLKKELGRHDEAHFFALTGMSEMDSLV